jgi:CDGSH-type Zn-finger protein
MDESRKAAAAALRSGQDLGTTKADSDDAFIAYLDDSAETAEPVKSEAQEDLTPAAKSLDRWFKDRQKQLGVTRLLDIPNEALVTSAGPLQITGNITLVNEDGSVQFANHLNLCRCGASRNKPTCDDRHLDIEFLHSGKIPEVSEAPKSQRPSKITISAIKDGPLTFRGRLRMHNYSGQECVRMRGSLCRCGQSTNKPFCDGSHNRVKFRTG